GEIAEKNIPPFSNQIDTVDLKNISKMIRIIIPDIEEDPVNIPDWRNNVRITIEGDNGAYLFNNRSGLNVPLVDPVAGHVIDNPFQRFDTKSNIDSLFNDDPVFTRDIVNDSEILVVDISTLRLVETDANMKIVIAWNSGIKDERIEIPLLEALKKNPDYAWGTNIQRDLDRQDEWEITFWITDTYFSVSTNVMQWHIVKQDVGIGGIMQ
ncbi:MAG: FimB/Mfa2 family fimbrial subunit, partial [Tannerella sp.]|nr:FimB/Mfa2 family fimbrial subunit [Tannerella sp.]